MFARIRRKRPGTPLSVLLSYECSRYIVVFLLTVLYRFRSYRAHRLPATGAVLLVANHQSYLDPPAIGAGVNHRHLDYIARLGLFEGRFLAWLLRQFNALPIREHGGDAGAIKEILRRLESGRAVLIFPEGTRTEDGAMNEFKRGIAVLVKRSMCPVIPVAVEGCFDAWPRHRRWPRLRGQRIAVSFGHPIDHESLMKDGADAALRRLESDTQRLRMTLRRLLRLKTRGRFPAAGPGDSDRIVRGAGNPISASA